MPTPFPEVSGSTFQPIVPEEALEGARRAHDDDPEGVLPTQMSRLLWAYFNGCGSRQGPSDLGSLQTAPGQRLLYRGVVRAWLAEIPDIAEEDIRLKFDSDNLAADWIALRGWFEKRKDSLVAAPLVQLVAHLEGEGAAPALRPVDVWYAYQHATPRFRIGHCLTMRDTGSMRDWIAACHEHGATALGVVQGPGEGPSGAADAALRIMGTSRYNTRSRVAVVDFATAEGVTRAWSAFSGDPVRHLDWK